METLHALFGSTIRVKLLRLFLLNESLAYDIGELSRRIQEKTTDITKELKLLEKAKVIKSKVLPRDVEVTSKRTVMVTPKPVKDKKGKIKKQKPKAKVVTTTKTVNKKVPTWALDVSCVLIPSLRTLLIESDFIKTKDIAKKLGKAGSIKLLVLSGIFVRNANDKVDIVIVGDKLDEKHLKKTVQKIESDVGKELRYSVFSPDEFAYRMNMFDKYLFDVFAAPHEKLIEKMQIPRP